jgi:hypothetical protein
LYVHIDYLHRIELIQLPKNQHESAGREQERTRVPSNIVDRVELIGDFGNCCCDDHSVLGYHSVSALPITKRSRRYKEVHTKDTRNTVAYTQARIVTSFSPLGYGVGSLVLIISLAVVLPDVSVALDVVSGVASTLTSFEDMTVERR